MGGIARTTQRIAQVIAGSSVPEDPGHSTNTLEWLLELDPKADAALRIAALGHDIERSIERRKILRENFEDFDAFKAAHAQNSARILTELLRECGAEDEGFNRDVFELVCRHEVGGDPRSDLLVDADSISYFDANLPLYLKRNTREESLRRCTWGYLRLSRRARAIVADLPYPDVDVSDIVAESIEAAEALEQGESRTSRS